MNVNNNNNYANRSAVACLPCHQRLDCANSTIERESARRTWTSVMLSNSRIDRRRRMRWRCAGLSKYRWPRQQWLDDCTYCYCVVRPTFTHLSEALAKGVRLLIVHGITSQPNVLHWAFRAIGIGFANVRSFVRHEISSSNISKTVRPRITKFYGDIHTDIVYSHTGYDVIIYFQSEVIGENSRWRTEENSCWIRNGNRLRKKAKSTSTASSQGHLATYGWMEKRQKKWTSDQIR